MKIKLERLPAQKVLHITEEVSSQNLDVLRAGAGKLVEAEPRVVVMNFIDAAVGDLGNFISEMRIAVSSRGGAAFFVGPQGGTDAPSLAILDQKLADPLARVLLIEAQLKAAHTMLTEKKRQLETQLAGTAAHDPRPVQKEQTSLKKMVAQMEGVVMDYAKRVGAPFFAKTATSHAALPKLHQVLDEVLKTQGVLK